MIEHTPGGENRQSAVGHRELVARETSLVLFSHSGKVEFARQSIGARLEVKRQEVSLWASAQQVDAHLVSPTSPSSGLVPFVSFENPVEKLLRR